MNSFCYFYNEPRICSTSYFNVVCIPNWNIAHMCSECTHQYCMCLRDLMETAFGLMLITHKSAHRGGALMEWEHTDDYPLIWGQPVCECLKKLRPVDSRCLSKCNFNCRAKHVFIAK
jgi:hypothetical protein